jgi:hypothetical protein
LRLREVKCAKETGKLLALAFLPKTDMALRKTTSRQRDKNGKLESDGMQEAMRAKQVFVPSCTEQKQRAAGMLLISMPIPVFMTGDLAS